MSALNAPVSQRHLFYFLSLTREEAFQGPVFLEFLDNLDDFEIRKSPLDSKSDQVRSERMLREFNKKDCLTVLFIGTFLSLTS